MTDELHDRRRLVVIESPFGTRPDGSRATAQEMRENVAYLHRCIKDSLARGEAPYASHGFFPQVLNDSAPEERKQGMESGFAWGRYGDLIAVYEDRGITPGMKQGIEHYRTLQIPIERRRLDP